MSGGPDDLCFQPLGRGGWVVWGIVNPSPSTDREYIDFNRVFQYKAGTYATGTKYLIKGPVLGTKSLEVSCSVFVPIFKHLHVIHLYLLSIVLYNWPNQGWGQLE